MPVTTIENMNAVQNRSMTNDTFGDSKLDRSTEMNPSMSIDPSSADEFETTAMEGK